MNIRQKIMAVFGLCEIDALKNALAAEYKAEKELERFKKEDYKRCMELMRDERGKKEAEMRKAETYRMELSKKTKEAEVLRYEVEKLQADLHATELYYQKKGCSLETLKKAKHNRHGKGGKA